MVFTTTLSSLPFCFVVRVRAASVGTPREVTKLWPDHRSQETEELQAPKAVEKMGWEQIAVK